VQVSKAELLKWASKELEGNFSSLKKFESGTIFLLLIAKGLI
jgi:hypothetical protein